MIARLVLHQKVRGKRDLPEHFYLEFCDQDAKHCHYPGTEEKPRACRHQGVHIFVADHSSTEQAEEQARVRIKELWG